MPGVASSPGGDCHTAHIPTWHKDEHPWLPLVRLPACRALRCLFNFVFLPNRGEKSCFPEKKKSYFWPSHLSLGAALSGEGRLEAGRGRKKKSFC